MKTHEVIYNPATGLWLDGSLARPYHMCAPETGANISGLEPHPELHWVSAPIAWGDVLQFVKTHSRVALSGRTQMGDHMRSFVVTRDADGNWAAKSYAFDAADSLPGET